MHFGVSQIFAGDCDSELCLTVSASACVIEGVAAVETEGEGFGAEGSLPCSGGGGYGYG